MAKSTVKVSNIKTEILGYDSIDRDIARDYKIKFTDTERKMIKKLLPKSNKLVFRYDLTNSCTALANGFRRTILDDILYPRLTTKIEEVVTDDEFCQRMTDYIQNRIQLIPVSYITPDPSIKMRLELKIHNDTPEQMTVMSSDIKKVDAKIAFDHDIEIIELQAGKSLTIPIYLEFGTNRIHASFCPAAQVYYQPLEFKEPFPSSTSVYPKDYRLGFTIQDDLINPVKLCIIAWETILEKLISASTSIIEYTKSGNTLYSSKSLDVYSVKGNRTVYRFYNETYTLANIIAWYTYQEDTSIKFIHAGDDHPEDPWILLKINHPESAKLMLNGIKTAIQDVEQIIKQLKKE